MMQMVDWTALLLGVALLGPQARPPVHPVTVLATHAQPSEFETRLTATQPAPALSPRFTAMRRIGAGPLR